MPTRIEHQIVDGVKCAWCTRCKQFLPLERFYGNCTRWDGLDSFCGICRLQYGRNHYRAHREEALTRIHKYYEGHREEVAVYEREWREAHPEKTRKYREARRGEAAAYAREYRKAHPEKTLVAARKYREGHPEYEKEYRKTHPEVYRNANHKRRAAMHRVTYEPCDDGKIYERDRGVCQFCHEPIGSELWQIDHFYPVSKDGPTIWENLRLLHKRCNLKKGDRLPTHDEAQAWLVTIQGWKQQPTQIEAVL